MAAWALANCHPPGREHRSFPAKSQGLWLPGELLEALLGELRPLVQSWIETGGLERWEDQEKAMPLHLLVYLLAKPRYSAQGSKEAEEAGRASQK